MLSDRLQQLPISSIRKLLPHAAAAKAEGVKVFHLNIGDPDIPTPVEMLDVLRNWEQPVIRYAPSRGDAGFLDATKEYYHSLGHTFVEEADMIVSVGGSEALQWTMFGVANPGEEIIVFEPYYSNYNSIAVATGVTLIPVETTIETGFHLPTREAILAKIGPKTRAILYTNPGNPTGANYTKAEIELLVSIAKEKKLYLVSDEPYREYVFDGEQVSLLSYMKEIPEYAILLDTVSKRWALCGARVGIFLSLNKSLIAATMRLAMARLSAGLIDQSVAAALCKVPKSYLEGVVAEYKKRRDLLFDGLKEIPGVFAPKPEGAFYMMVSLPVDNAENFAKFLLETYRNEKNETLMLAPGGGFYANEEKGINQVRIAYILNQDDLKSCLQIIRDGLAQYNALKQ